MLPSSHDLRYFVEAASTQNLSRAAEKLGISQPSLTLSIQRLEAAMGVPLLIRTKRGVVPTQSGKQLLSRARLLLQTWEDIRVQAVQSHMSVSGTYTLGCHVSVAQYTLPRFLPSLLKAHPGLELRLLHDLSRRIVESIIALQTDIGIVINPVRHPDLVIKKIGTDEVTLWSAGGARKIPERETSQSVLIGDPELLQTQELLRKLERAQIRFKRFLPTSSLEVIARLTAAGAGVGILPGRVAATITGSTLRRIEGMPIFRDELFVVYRSENRDSIAIRAIAKAAAEALST